MADIAFIAPYEDLAHIARQVSHELGLEVDVYVARVQDGAELARTLAKKTAVRSSSAAGSRPG